MQTLRKRESRSEEKSIVVGSFGECIDYRLPEARKKSSRNAEPSKEIKIHLNKLKEDWKKKRIGFDESVKAKMISVVFHSAISEEENEIFIGHVGVLVPTEDGKFLFVEKLTFNEPYQAVMFENKQGVSDYLMNRYDIEWNQPTASPMVLENGSLMEGYRRKKRE